MKTTVQRKSAQAQRRKDKYDRAMAWFKKYPSAIQLAWSRPNLARGGCLFDCATPDGLSANTPSGEHCGCLTTIREHAYVAWTPELTAAILADDRIPMKANIRVSDLPVFAEWQRRLDREIRGKVLAHGHQKKGVRA